MRAPYPAADLDFVLEHTSWFWEEFKDSRVLMTGGTGLIGSWLLECVQRANRRLQAGVTVTVVSRNPKNALALAPHLFGDPAFTLVAGDVQSFVCPDGKYDLCVHAATDVGDAERATRHLDVFDVNVLGTRRLLDLASKASVGRFLLLSSGAVYGPQSLDTLHVDETCLRAPDPLKITSAYGEGKRAAEWLTAAYGQRSEMVTTVARVFAVVGPGTPLDGPFAAGNFIRDALAGKPLKMTGDGSPLRSFLYLADACIWLLYLLGRGRACEAYNVGSEHAVSIAQLAELVAAKATPRGAAVLPAALAASNAARYVPSTKKARQTFSLREWTPLDAALENTLNWLKAAPCN